MLLMEEYSSIDINEKTRLLSPSKLGLYEIGNLHKRKYHKSYNKSRKIPKLAKFFKKSVDMYLK